MRAAIIGAATLALLAQPARAGFPYNGLPPVPADAATMVLAQATVGTTCRFEADKVGPQVKGFANLPHVGQGLLPDGFVFVRRRGPQRVAFLARDPEHGACRILAVQPLPPKARSEAFLECEVQDPDPFKNTPLAQGLGLRRNGEKRLASFLVADTKAKTLVPADGSDRRIKCYEFESGD